MIPDMNPTMRSTVRNCAGNHPFDKHGFMKDMSDWGEPKFGTTSVSHSFHVKGHQDLRSNASTTRLRNEPFAA